MLIIISVLVLLLLICFLIYKWLQFNPITKNSDINRTCNSKEGKFVIKGKKNKFIICKDDNISFLIEDGQIVACKDKRVSDEFKFYGRS